MLYCLPYKYCVVLNVCVMIIVLTLCIYVYAYHRLRCDMSDYTISFYNRETGESSTVTQVQNAPLPNFPKLRWQLTLNVFYDEAFRGLHGNNHKEKAYEILDATKPLFHDAALTTKIDLKLNTMEYVRGVHWHANKETIDTLKKNGTYFKDKEKVNGFVFLGVTDNDKDGVLGTISAEQIGSICSNNETDRIAVVEYTGNMSKIGSDTVQLMQRSLFNCNVSLAYIILTYTNCLVLQVATRTFISLFR